MKVKEGFKKISLVSITNLANLGLGLILFLAVAVKLPKEEFGLYGLLTLLLVSLSKIIDFGSNSSFVSEYISKGKNFVNELINFKIFAFFISSILGLIIIKYLNNISSLSIQVSFVLGLFFYGINYLLFALYQKDEKLITASLLNFFPAIIKAYFGVMAFLGAINLNLDFAFQIFALSMSGSSVLLFYKFRELSNFKFSFEVFRFLKNFFLAGISQIINESWNTISNQILVLLRSLADLGNFSLASKLSNVFSVISYSIYTVILTTNAKRKKNFQGYNLIESLILGAALLIVATIGTIIAPFFFKIVFGDKFDESILIFSILIFSQAFASIHKFLDNYFFVEEKSQVLFLFTNIKLISFILLSTLLTINYGIVGLALADLVVSIFTTTITFIYINNKITKSRI